MQRAKWCFTLLLALLWSTRGLADAPLPPPRDFDAYSPSRTCVAHAQLEPSRIVGARLKGGAEETLWTLPSYQRFFYLADDCRSVMVMYGGANLLGLDDYQPSTVVLTVVHDGATVRRIALGEIYTDLSVLRRTVSHWHWIDGVAWEAGWWAVRTVDGRKLYLNQYSGRPAD